MAAKRGLGRGLDALIQDAPVESADKLGEAGDGVRKITISSIVQGSHQPRQVFESEPLEELVNSIKLHGVLQPLLVRRAGEKYELVAGERRLRAATLAGLSSVPAIVREIGDADALVLGLIENLQREDLNPIEEAEGYRKLSEQFGMTQEDISRSVGKARATVANAIRLLELPKEIRALVMNGSISAGHAKALLSLEVDEEKRLLARRAVKEAMSVRALERAIARLIRTPRKQRVARMDMPTEHLKYLSDKLYQHFGSNVRVFPSKTLANGKKKKGTIEIDFYSNEDLDRILELLGVAED